MFERSDAARWRKLLALEPPQVAPLALDFPRPREVDPVAAVQRELRRPEIRASLRPGATVALGVGSRGLAGLLPLVRTAVAELSAVGCRVVIVPAMGSHGGATAAGQRALLAHYGIDEAAVGAPIDDDIEATLLGNLPDGTPVYFSRAALAADLVVPLNRVKPHTSFRAQLESGLVKMLVVGFGKHAGAQALHAGGYERFAETLRAAATQLLERIEVPFGLATVENAYGELARVEAVPGHELLTREGELLREARALLAKLPLTELDVLVVCEAGKNISGLGMDPNVTGRYASGLQGDLEVTRLALLRLTAETEGNAIGVGLADVTTAQVAAAIDPDATWINAVTSGSVAAAKLPPVMPDERTAVALALRTCGRPPAAARLAVVRSTSKLSPLLVSEALLGELAERGLEPAGPLGPMPFDVDGRLLWP